MPRLQRALGLLAALSAAGSAAGVERPVAGQKLALGSFGPVSTLDFVARDPRIGAPFADPRRGSALRIGASSAEGRCRREIRLDPDAWFAWRGRGAERGYVYLHASLRGLLLARIREGQIRVLALGEPASCELGAPQSLPLTVEVRAESDRFCSAFGGEIESNEAGSFRARRAPAPAACDDADVTVANLNILHGFACGPPMPGTTDQCRLSDRLDLLFQHLVAIGCPDIVTLQENVTREVVQRSATEWVGPLTSTRAEIEARLAGAAQACGFPYHVVFDPPMEPPRADDAIKGDDEEMILSRHPVLRSELRLLHSALFASPGLEFSSRHALYARIDHPAGPVDVFTAHLASNGDFARNPCNSVLDFGQGFVAVVPCPPECEASQTVRECQARQLALFVEERHDVAMAAVITGDFNSEPGSAAYQEFAGRGWIDSYLAAGNPECDPGTGFGCTSGRVDDALDQLESPASNQQARIDFTFLVPPQEVSLCAAEIDPAGDPDRDRVATRIFTDQPNPFAPACGPAPLPICWPSDHEGSELDLNCAR